MAGYTLEQYLERIPEKYRNKVKLINKFQGKRTKVLFTNEVCGCEREYFLGVLVLRKTFDVCKHCRSQYVSKKYFCKRCGKGFITEEWFLQHDKKCLAKFKNLIEGEDYVTCYICGFQALSLGLHLRVKHGIDPEEYKKDHQIICRKSSDIYAKQNLENSEVFRSWIKERGPEAQEYLNKRGKELSKSIMSNPEERKRRSKAMAILDRTEYMRKKASETAIKTSARKDIQEKRAAQLKRWRDNNPEIFYEKCVSKMLNTWHSKPETILFEAVLNYNDYVFKRNQIVKSEIFPTKSKRKQIDIGDKSKRVYIEFDGQLHFKETQLKQLERVQLKDGLLDKHIIKHGWTLIRVSYDQFSYRKRDFGFKKECLEKVFEILDNPTPGVHTIGEAYDAKKETNND